MQGASAMGRQIASIGPHLGVSFSIHPVRPIPNMAKPRMTFSSQSKYDNKILEISESPAIAAYTYVIA
ncbi:hypothetical protein KL86PLE_60358 [uncultured Pleomorphomonas sp.]|uniref:Uncharacterized protein n=1 Tax=uncultured Pleomorphomonas sp. TaxID=442121 RepID=A0A212LKF1_9HYPH|nr:hypothetical protein KL86PLE_60358 [uncultured Pleomorphomonas sp.]